MVSRPMVGTKQRRGRGVSAFFDPPSSATTSFAGQVTARTWFEARALVMARTLCEPFEVKLKPKDESEWLAVARKLTAEPPTVIRKGKR